MVDDVVLGDAVASSSSVWHSTVRRSLPLAARRALDPLDKVVLQDFSFTQSPPPLKRRHGYRTIAPPARVVTVKARFALVTRSSTPRACQTKTRFTVCGQFGGSPVAPGLDDGGDASATSGRGVENEVPADG